jgi:hypothetical protein
VAENDDNEKADDNEKDPKILASKEVDDVLPRKEKSKLSLASSLGGAGYGRELSETLSTKLYEMLPCFLALVFDILLLVFVISLNGDVAIGVSTSFARSFGPVIFEVVLLFSNIFTTQAIDRGYQAYIGKTLAKHGTSMAVCGFSQVSSIFKLNFANNLSLNSSVRKVLARISYLWILLDIMKILSPIPATALYSHDLTEKFGTSSCIEFNQNGIPFDRLWPDIAVEAGVAELVFGTSIGNLRSENDTDITIGVVGPQLVGAVEDGDTITGNGFTADMLTRCD